MLGDRLRATQGQERVGSKKGWILSFWFFQFKSGPRLCLTYIHTEVSLIPKTYDAFFLVIYHMVTSSHWEH